MPSTYTTSFLIEKPGEFEQVNTWGPIVNRNMDKLDGRLGREVTIDVSPAINTVVSGNQNAVGDTECFSFILTGSLVNSKELILPSTLRGLYVLRTKVTFNGFTLTVSGGGGANTVSLSQQETVIIYVTNDGVERLPSIQSSAIIGEIRMYAGDPVGIPSGWFICDGSNGTPDLRGRFIKAGTTSGATGGTASGTTASSSISFSGNSGAHVLTADEIPGHRHLSFVNSVVTSFQDLTPNESPAKEVSIDGNNDQYAMSSVSADPTVGRTSSTGGGQGHTHSISFSNVGAHTHTFTVDPPFYELIMIQYRG